MNAKIFSHVKKFYAPDLKIHYIITIGKDKQGIIRKFKLINIYYELIGNRYNRNSIKQSVVNRDTI